MVDHALDQSSDKETDSSISSKDPSLFSVEQVAQSLNVDISRGLKNMVLTLLLLLLKYLHGNDSLSNSKIH